MREIIKDKIPLWLISAILVFPFIFIIGFIIYISGGNFFYFMILPSIIFEEVLERYVYDFSNNQLANLGFVIFFWFIIGAVVGFIIDKITS